MYILKKAFTLIELLISVSIITVILSVVLWNYGSFNDQLALSATAQELALTIREMQTYSINVKETSAGSGQFNHAYGIHFNIASPYSYRLYIDSDDNGAYDHKSGCYTGNTECTNRVDIRNKIKISSVCDSSTCPPSGAAGFNVFFLRPNPDAKIYFVDSSFVNILGPVTQAKVQLTSPNGKVMYVIVESTGQISIQ
ncbi:MAG: Uncharacterized protein CEO12_402 [Parcubacteria group bacterium Gr01-1014_46]|nr:MAG: Uncharacterized protein CEO12_402 [Parcubacteria group bacterium Gr01-1014_46]